jgi:hypothetical protein
MKKILVIVFLLSLNIIISSKDTKFNSFTISKTYENGVMEWFYYSESWVYNSHFKTYVMAIANNNEYPIIVDYILISGNNIDETGFRRIDICIIPHEGFSYNIGVVNLEDVSKCDMKVSWRKK